MPVVCPSTASADAVRRIVDAAEPGELPALAAELGRALPEVLIRFAAQTAAIAAPPLRERSGELLTVEQAAKRYGLAKTWLYRHAKGLPFTRKLGHRTLRFDAHALEKWLSTRPNA